MQQINRRLNKTAARNQMQATLKKQNLSDLLGLQEDERGEISLNTGADVEAESAL